MYMFWICINTVQFGIMIVYYSCNVFLYSFPAFFGYYRSSVLCYQNEMGIKIVILNFHRIYKVIRFYLFQILSITKVIRLLLFFLFIILINNFPFNNSSSFLEERVNTISYFPIHSGFKLLFNH